MTRPFLFVLACPKSSGGLYDPEGADGVETQPRCSFQNAQFGRRITAGAGRCDSTNKKLQWKRAQTAPHVAHRHARKRAERIHDCVTPEARFPDDTIHSCKWGRGGTSGIARRLLFLLVKVEPRSVAARLSFSVLVCDGRRCDGKWVALWG